MTADYAAGGSSFHNAAFEFNEFVQDLQVLERKLQEVQSAAVEYNNANSVDYDGSRNDIESLSSETIQKYKEWILLQQSQGDNDGASVLSSPAREFCGTCHYRDQDFTCNDRIQWVMEHKHKTEEEAILEDLQYCSNKNKEKTVQDILGNNNWKHQTNNNNHHHSSNKDYPYPLLPKSNWDQYSMEPLQILKRAGVDPTEGFIPSMRMSQVRKAARLHMDIEKQPIEQLPSVSEIKSLYGDKSYVVGMERCQAYRDAVSPELRLMGPAGIFNTGTNLLSQLLKMNCINNARHRSKQFTRPRDAPSGMKLQAPWGKHNPVSWRLHHEAAVGGKGTNQEEFLPIVMIKDPLTWMESMCRHSYEARWRHFAEHCPNLVANRYDRGRESGEIVPVFVKFATKHIGDEPLPDPKNRTFIQYDSLVEVWNRWYMEWMEVDFPRLMVRFEDLLFHAEETISQICDCAGGKMRPRFRYIEDSAKGSKGPHKGSGGFLASLVTYGNSTKRMKDILTEEADYEFAKKNLDETLMREFGYAPL